MEIHPPHGGIRSAKDFFVQLSMIVLGIVIALGLEGMVEWAHHRSLVREARANIAAEIADNHRRVAETLSGASSTEQQLQKLLQFIHALQASHKPPEGKLEFILSRAQVDETNWNSAISTGALSYMKLSEVQRYTRLYALQHVFLAAQDRGLESAAQVQSIGPLLEKGPKTLTDRELEQAESSLRMALANTRIIEQLGRALASEYENFGGRDRSNRAVTASR